MILDDSTCKSAVKQPEVQEIIHHWHAPTQGQLIKAMHQYFTEMGITKELLLQRVEFKIDEVLSTKLDTLVKSGRFDGLLVSAVVAMIKNEQAVFDKTNGYGMHNRVRDLVMKQLQELVLKDYVVSVTKKESS